MLEQQRRGQLTEVVLQPLDDVLANQRVDAEGLERRIGVELLGAEPQHLGEHPAQVTNRFVRRQLVLRTEIRRDGGSPSLTTGYEQALLELVVRGPRNALEGDDRQGGLSECGAPCGR